MSRRLITAGLVLAFLSLLLPWIGLPLIGGGLIPPSPEVLIFVNDKELHTVEQPVKVDVEKEKIVHIRVKVYYQGKPTSSGELTYQWCFDPPINNNIYCSVDGYRSETNSDYKPETSDEQKLEISIHHRRLKALTVSILFKPE